MGKIFDGNCAYIEVWIHAEGLESTREALLEGQRSSLGRLQHWYFDGLGWPSFFLLNSHDQVFVEFC